MSTWLGPALHEQKNDTFGASGKVWQLPSERIDGGRRTRGAVGHRGRRQIAETAADRFQRVTSTMWIERIHGLIQISKIDALEQDLVQHRIRVPSLPTILNASVDQVHSDGDFFVLGGPAEGLQVGAVNQVGLGGLRDAAFQESVRSRSRLLDDKGVVHH